MGVSAGSAGAESVARGAASRGDRTARHLPASFYFERPRRTEHRANSAGAGNYGGGSKKEAAPPAGHAAEKTRCPPPKKGPRAPRGVRGRAMKNEGQQHLGHIS